MGFLGNMITATVKVALTPVAMVKDAVKIVVGVNPDSTKKLLESAKDSFDDAIEGY